MVNQKHLFNLPPDVHYLNGAYMSPQLLSVSEAGKKILSKKEDPTRISAEDFFEPAKRVRELFGEIVHSPSTHVAIIPSVSYGMQSVFNNISGTSSDSAVTVSDVFPSGYYAMKGWQKRYHAQIKIVDQPISDSDDWTDRIMDAIDINTKVVLVPHVHWMNGYLFDLKRISERCNEMDAYLVVDGSQSVGALPLHVDDIRVDALICAAYKWLMCPYTTGVAYYGERLQNGAPIEETWMNRINATQFSSLTHYNETYTPNAGRYNMGEFSNFIHLQMMIAAFKQILDWNPADTQSYAYSLQGPYLEKIQSMGIQLPPANRRAAHLLGLQLPEHMQSDDLVRSFNDHQVYVSIRGSNIRLSTHVYNIEADFEALVTAVSACV